MRVIRSLALSAFLVACLCPAIPAANAQVSIGFSVNIEPPPLPVYEQPVIPGPGYLWTPGYWAWNPDIDDYYWVPGTWVLPPEPNLLWTPGYWAWNDAGAYVFNDGYWGPEVGFYGGVNYGFGYGGAGYEGGYWRNGALFYNRTVNNISSVAVTNVYSKTVVVNNTSRVGFNGGASGIAARPTPQQVAFAKERHVPPTQQQTQHVQTAAKDPALSLTKSQGHPAVAATAQPGQLKGPGVIAAHPGTPVMPARPLAPSNAAGTPANAGTPPNPATSSKPGTLSKPGAHALPGFSPQPGGKPGPAGTGPAGTGPAGTAATGDGTTGPSRKGPHTKGPSATGPSTTGPGTTGPSTTGPSTTGPGTTGPGAAGEKRKKVPPSSATTTVTPDAAKPVVPTTPHPTPSTAIHTPPPPVVHTPPPPVVHAPPPPVVHAPPPPKPAGQPLAAKPVAPPSAAPPPPPHAGPPPGKPKCAPGQQCK